MTRHRAPTREAMKLVLDALFFEILDAGERSRAEQPPGTPPEWAPCPQEDERYEGLEPEEWDKIATLPELEARDWEDSVLVNRLYAVEPTVDATMERLGIFRPPDGPDWRLFLRFALIATARARRLDAERAHSNYGGGWPVNAPIPTMHIPDLVSVTHSASDELPARKAQPETQSQQRTPRRRGPKSVIPLVLNELQRIHAAGQKFDTLSDLARTLEELLRNQHGKERAVGWRHIENQLRKLPLQPLADEVCPPRPEQPHSYKRSSL